MATLEKRAHIQPFLNVTVTLTVCVCDIHNARDTLLPVTGATLISYITVFVAMDMHWY